MVSAIEPYVLRLSVEIRLSFRGSNVCTAKYYVQLFEASPLEIKASDFFNLSLSFSFY